MADPARQLLDALRAALATPAANTGAVEWVTLAADATARGRSTRAHRAWCIAHGVHLRGTHRDVWVRPVDVDRAVAGLPTITARDEVDEAIANARR